MRNEQITEKIKDLEKQLSELRIELENQEPKEGSTAQKNKSQETSSQPLKIGEEVVVLNPKRGQGRRGILTKVNSITGYGTVETVNEKNRTEKVVRKIKNLKRV